VEKPRILLIKPPERSEFDFGVFSLAALAASVTDRAEVAIFDATSLSCVDAASRIWKESPEIVGVTVMGSGSVPSSAHFIEALVDHPARKQATILAGGWKKPWPPAASGVGWPRPHSTGGPARPE
jgi:hypothetical protein